MQLGAQTLSLETGKLAKQAHGAAVVGLGDSLVLVAAVEGPVDDKRDFFPLVVDYREKTYSAGKFPGGFIKREGRPTTKEILTARLIDRPIRPLFPAGYRREVQIMGSTLSYDRENDPDILCMIGSSAALHLSQIPFLKVTGTVRLGRIGNEYIVMPTLAQLEESDLDLVVSGTRDAVTMIEGFAREMSEENMLQAIQLAQREIARVIGLIEEFRKKAGLSDKPPYPEVAENPLKAIFRKQLYDEFATLKLTSGKAARADAIKALKDRVTEQYAGEDSKGEYTPAQVSQAFEWLEERVIRDLILEGKRLDGRGPRDLRKITCEVGLLPRTHGSAVFTRGETQALVTTTLGTVSDEQRVDGLIDEYKKKFMLDYNFPPFSVGETRPIRGPGRREIGHGALAERSLKPVIPEPSKFPYTIRVVSDILESNGSSSMASVCGGTLSLMDAGVPISDPVAGISIGLVKESSKFTLLTDIMGDEDHYGDMDFKVAGTVRGITGIQLDLKIDGIDEEIIRATLDQAREAPRDPQGDRDDTALSAQRDQQAGAAAVDGADQPRKDRPVDRPGRQDDQGHPGGDRREDRHRGRRHRVHLARRERGALAAKAKVDALTEEVRIGKVYEGKVTLVKEFGAFIEILPGRDGLCHISELDDKYVEKVENVCKVGDKLTVKVIAIDDQDRVKLSRKAILRDQRGGGPPPGDAPGPRGDGPGRDRPRPPRGD